MENRTQMPKLDSLEPLMIEELRDLLDAEKQITKALPKMAKAASSDELKAAFEEHLEQTSQQLERLNQVFEHIGERPRAKKCVAMESLIEEGEQMLGEAEEGPTRDALLIASAQKVEHYEMAAYGTARTFANLLGHNEAADLLEQTLEQEKQTDMRLTEIAESVSNPLAAGRGNELRRTANSGRGRMTSAADRSSSSGRGKATSGASSGRGARKRSSSGSRRSR
jgi:ferritin-like metal-binding protein YciE